MQALAKDKENCMKKSSKELRNKYGDYLVNLC